MTEKVSILCVDDDASLLKGLVLHLGRRYNVKTAESVESGIAVMAKDGPFAAVLSDMRMPGKDGSHFLAAVRTKWPETVRMVLTGQTDVDSAIRAVNNGQIFRFLTKPCAPDQLLGAFEAAVGQNALLRNQRELLEKTLKGSIDTLVDILAIANPLAFGKASRLKAHVKVLGAALGISETWSLETAAMLSQIGCIVLPPETLRRIHEGVRLDSNEESMLENVPGQARKLLAHIPRMEPILDILAGLQADPVPQDQGKHTPSAILRMALDFESLESRGMDVQTIFGTLRGRTARYDPGMLAAFAEAHGRGREMRKIVEVGVGALQPGMIFSEDLKSQSGALLVARGFVASTSLIDRLRNLPQGTVPETLRVEFPLP